jgi:hypothetical protein
MSAIVQQRKESGIAHKDTAWALLVELDKTREDAIKKTKEYYNKIFDKYHSYWCSSEGGIVPEQRCGYCGGHTYEDHPKDGDKSVSRYGISCHKKSVSLAILEYARFNNSHMFERSHYRYADDTNHFLKSIQSRLDRTRDGRHLEYDFTIEEIKIIFDNQVKYGRICFCNDGKPTLTEKGRMVLEKTAWSGKMKNND